MTQNNMAQQLYQSRKMHTEKEIEHFEEALLALSSTRDASVLPHLFAAFDDSTEQSEVMWGLLHTVESYEREAYLLGLAKAIPSMILHAKNWVLISQYRILNNDHARSMYRKIITTLPAETKKVVRNVLEEIGNAEPRFSDRVQDMLKE
jgi:hypothetical protein